MMKKLREKMITLSFNLSIQCIFGISLFLVCMVLLTGIISKRLDGSVMKIAWCITFIFLLIYNAMSAIREAGMNVVQKNSLICIVLSLENVWHTLLLWGVVTPILLVINMFVDLQFINAFELCIIIVVIELLLWWVTKKIAAIFKKKLKV